MDGGNTIDVNVEADESRDVVTTIPLLLAFDEPETVEPINEELNLPEAESEPVLPQELVEISEMPLADTTVTTVRLGSGADDNPSAAADDAESENVDMRGSRRRSGSRRRRRSRSRSRRSRSRSRRSQSRSRRGRSRSRRGRSRSDDSDMSVVLQIAQDEESDELMAGGSRGGQKLARGSDRNGSKTAPGGRHVGKTAAARGSRIDKNQSSRGDRKSAKRGRRGWKTAASMQPRTLWSDRLRPRNTYRKKKSQSK
ncbi:U1 small nuclear ribonucleoprotein 70 kDa-like [Melanaphis sacchari]|uniref:U1 small nuclear ribonucleoprotein 70 kDa-like n=1 Tax=Melanaphis sacchari TaxID=742174 RepID=UPI000DC1429E|nr:U1 small nuclear ribonucleoprotein 70 kDa-like [Melanaphis sacchari]